MSYDFILEGSLIVGDYEAAKDLNLLRRLNVTHIVACGFARGHHKHQNFHYFCVDVLDTPSSNLLRHLPRATKFIENALRDETSVVLVHCVHGQSRSCAVCVAHLLSDGGDLHACYRRVREARPQMAINPGFVVQLEMFRRMKNAARGERLEGPIQSKAHAAFRSSRAKAEYYDDGRISRFCPLVASGVGLVCCRNCRVGLFTESNVVDDWAEEEYSSLPVSEYWMDSKGGVDYRNSHLVPRKKENAVFEALLCDKGGVCKVEPMEWMRSIMLSNGSVTSRGALLCPSCSSKIGYWDWCNEDASIVIMKHELIIP